MPAANPAPPELAGEQLRPPARLIVVASAFFVPTMGYAATVSSIPDIERRVGIGEDTVAILLLATLVCAAGGSLLADRIAVLWGSRQAVMVGLSLQVVALCVNATTESLVALVIGLCLFGLGLGATDASANMQGSLAQQHRSSPIFGRLYAAGTTGAILGSLLTAGAIATGLPQGSAMLVAAALALVSAVGGWFAFDPARAASAPRTKREPLPWRGIGTVGVLVFAAFAVDSSVASWSTAYLDGELVAQPALTPLGYSAYLAVALLSRVLADPLVGRFGRSAIAAVGALCGGIGLFVVVLVPTVMGAIVGFAAAGIAFGLLVPIAFSRAGELLPARSDEVIARVNLFNYAAGLIGAVIPGLLSPVFGLGPTFLVGVVALAAAVPAIRSLRRNEIVYT